MHRSAAVALVTAVCLACAGSALATFSQGSYTGTLAKPRTAITIAITLHGGRARAHISDVPLYCSGGGPAQPVSFGAAKVARRGTFTAKAVNRIKVGPLKGKVGERLTLTGRFAAHGKVSGKLATVYPDAKTCGGTSRFTAAR